MAMAEAEQRSRLAILERESLIATDLAREEARHQQRSLNGRLNLEALGIWLGALSSLFIFVGALVFAYLAPNAGESAAAILLAALPGIATLVAAFRRRRTDESTASSSDAPPPSKAKRRR